MPEGRCEWPSLVSPERCDWWVSIGQCPETEDVRETVDLVGRAGWFCAYHDRKRKKPYPPMDVVEDGRLWQWDGAQGDYVDAGEHWTAHPKHTCHVAMKRADPYGEWDVATQCYAGGWTSTRRTKHEPISSLSKAS